METETKLNTYSGEFLVPDYYKNFRCKGGDCRTCCCAGWAVTVSMQEYFRLLGLECSPELRYKIDGALHLLKDADPDRYAQILPSYTGDCPMRRQSDGYCGLQCECGEEVLPAVCRYYPRSPRLYPFPECCVSNSCEKVLEDLVASPDKLTFEKRPLSFDFTIVDDPNKPQEYVDTRKGYLALLSDRSRSLSERIKRIADTLCGSSETYFKREGTDERLLDLFSRSPSIGEECQNLLAKKARAEESFRRAKEKFPDGEIWAEKILSNHFYYMKFPYCEQRLSFADAGKGLVALCRLWSLLCGDDSVRTKDDFVDVTGKLFRVVEHTRFYHNAAVVTGEDM